MIRQAINGNTGNRYFDPTSGRLTRQDPPGNAGGLNAYGFAEVGPINFSDPFGLCPKVQNRGECDTSRPEHDPAFKAQLEVAGKKAEANTWLSLRYSAA
jgi:uncharacterized protein RhaS with RHS repeats